MGTTAKSTNERPKALRPVSGSGPTRQCLGCGRRGAQVDFLRLTLDRKDAAPRVMPESGGARSGRGAYLCLKQACLDQALHRRAFQRAFRATVTVDRDEVAAAIATRVGCGEANDTAGG